MMRNKSLLRINILEKGDSVLSILSTSIAVKRKNGEVDIIPFVYDEDGVFRIVEEKIITIGYGDNSVEVIKDGVKYESF